MNNYTRQSIGREKAIALYESGWWKGLPDHEVAMFQFFTDESCMDFGEFQLALERTLGRPVWTHELGSGGWDRIAAELMGDKPAPTMDEIIGLIPEEKRILLTVQTGE